MEKDVKVVERLEDINYMEGIDFKLNQRLSKIDDELRILKKKQKQKNRLENILLSICLVIAITITIMLSFMIFKNDDKTIDDCVNKGYSRPYCEKSIYGL